MAAKIQENLRDKIFGVAQYNDVIAGFKEYLGNLNYEERKLLKRGRFNNFYNEISKCMDNKQQNSNLCFKEKLHQECQNDYNAFERCVGRSKTKKNDCNQTLGQYFICVDRNMKNIYLSSSYSF